MRLLHGSNDAVYRPDLSLCESKNDFGRGFYLTPNWNRAWEMGKRKKNILQSGEIKVSVFNFTMKAAKSAGLKIATFPGFTTEWARFVINNRDNDFFSHPFDIVIGPVADAILDQEIYMHKRTFGKKYLEDDALATFIDKVSQFGSSYIQYCFCTPKAIEQLKSV